MAKPKKRGSKKKPAAKASVKSSKNPFSGKLKKAKSSLSKIKKKPAAKASVKSSKKISTKILNKISNRGAKKAKNAVSKRSLKKALKKSKHPAVHHPYGKKLKHERKPKHQAISPLPEKKLEHKASSKDTPLSAKIDFAAIQKEIDADLKKGAITPTQAEIKKQRAGVEHVVKNAKHPERRLNKQFIKTGIEGLDTLIEGGIPKGTTILVAGGAGSGKTIMCLQILQYHALRGEKCLYMSFEESEDRLWQHMDDFGWDSEQLRKKGTLRVQRFNPFDITRSVDALLMKAKGELLIDVEPIVLPKGFTPDLIVVDSLTAIASAFTGKEDSYRIYIEQLFRFFERIGATAFLVTETKQVPTVFSTTGVEEFLADGVIILYSLQRGNVREYATEVLKMRGTKHQKKIVAMQITEDGVVIYPEQEVFSNINSGSG